MKKLAKLLVLLVALAMSGSCATAVKHDKAGANPFTCRGKITKPVVYTVKNGDCLWNIGKKYGVSYQSIAELNKIPDPNRIYPDQKFQIPEAGQKATVKMANSTVKSTASIKANSSAQAKSAKAAVLAPAKDISYRTIMINGVEYVQIIERTGEIKLWSRYNGNPYGIRDPADAIDKFSLPDEVKEGFKKAYAEGRFVWFEIPKSFYLNQMGFGRVNTKIWNDVLSNGPDGVFLASRLYMVEYKGRIYCLVIPLICHNPAWIVLKVPEKATPPSAPPEIPSTPPTETTPPQSAPPEITSPPPAEKTPPPPQPTGKYRIELDQEIYGWAGHYWPTQGSGYSSYFGGRANLFITKHDTYLGSTREGVSLTYNQWHGESSSSYDYSGNRWSVGPVIDFSGNRADGKEAYKWAFTAQYGEQTDHGRTMDGRYASEQRTKILYFNVSNDYYPQKYFDKIETWFDTVVDIGNDKSSSYDGWKIPSANDPSNNKTNFGIGSRLYFWNMPQYYVRGGVQVRGDYGVDDEHIGKGIGPFISDSLMIVKAGFDFRNVNNSKYDDGNGNAVGLNTDFDIGQIIKMFSRKLNAKETKIESGTKK